MSSDKKLSPPVVLTIAGSDSSAGAGIQADLKAIHANGGYALTVVTGVVAESPHEVVDWQAMPQELIMDQVRSVCEAYPVAAVKIGLLFDVELVEILASFLQGLNVPIVIDPVGTASAGGGFGGAQVREAIAKHLFPIATVVTPNLLEAQGLTLTPEIQQTQVQLACNLREQFETAILVKGGHSADEKSAIDVLVLNNGEIHYFSDRRIQGVDYHGTGCSLSSAIATHLALGESLKRSTEIAKSYLHKAMLEGLVWVSPARSRKTSALNLFLRNS